MVRGRRSKWRWLWLPACLTGLLGSALLAVFVLHESEPGSPHGRAPAPSDRIAPRSEGEIDDAREPATEPDLRVAAPGGGDVPTQPDAFTSASRFVGRRAKFLPSPEAGATNRAEAETLRRMRADAELAGLKSRGGTLGIGGSAGGRVGTGATSHVGRVVDAITGESIPGAEVISLLVPDDGFGRRWTSVVVGEDGSYRLRVTQRRDEVTQIAVRAAGYRSVRRAYAGAASTWRLRRSTGNGRGSLRGRAHTDENAPLSGMLIVDLRGELGDRFSAFTWSDAAGRYRIDGLRAGRWRAKLVRARGREPWVEATVPEGGEGVADLVADKPDAPLPDRPGSDRRVVLVTGPPDGTVIRAEGGKTVFWLGVVERGVARFALPLGIWVMRRDHPGAAPEVLTVEAGAGPQDFVLSK